MTLTLYLFIEENYAQSLFQTFVSNYPNHTINFIFPKEIPAEKYHSKSLIFLCDRDEEIQKLSAQNHPVIAVSHEGNTEESLMGTHWLILSYDALSPEFLEEVYYRFYHLPLTVCKTPRCLLRELMMEDFPFLLQLQKENQENAAGCFFPKKMFSAEISSPETFLSENKKRTFPSQKENTCTSEDAAKKFLSDYIQNQYPFYGFGLYAILEKGSGKWIGIAGFSLVDSHTAEISYSLLEKWQHQGFASEAVGSLLLRAKTRKDFEHIIARIEKNNTASAAVARKNEIPILPDFPDPYFSLWQ